jgi:hypothetical protein
MKKAIKILYLQAHRAYIAVEELELHWPGGQLSPHGRRANIFDGSKRRTFSKKLSCIGPEG